MAPETTGTIGELDSKKVALEQQYINLLEQRVAQLQKLVTTSSESKKDTDESQVNGKSEPTKGKPAEGATTITPLTTENVAKVPDGTLKTSQTPTAGKGRVRQVISTYDEKSGSREDKPAEEADAKKTSTEAECFLRNVMDPSEASKLLYNEIELGPGPIRDLITEALSGSGNQFWTGSRVSLFSPFVQLVHNWDQLQKAAKAEIAADKPERKNARADLARILDYVEGSKDLESYFKNRESYVTSGVITYEHMWTVFPVGLEVISTTFLDQQQILKVETSPFATKDDKKTWMWCWYYDHDGTQWTSCDVELEIEKFEGTKPINLLPCCPLKWYRGKGEVTDLGQQRTRLISRGKRFKALSTAKRGVEQMFNYDAPLLSVERPLRSQYSTDDTDERSVYQSSSERLRNDSTPPKRAQVDGRIIVDPRFFREYAPIAPAEWLLGEIEAYNYETSDKRLDVSEDEKCLTAPPRVLGWSTRRKTWCQFLVDKVENSKKANLSVFDKELELDDQMKKMIRALVTHHNTSSDSEDARNPDLIEGKGRGLVLLLHGPPGVGKTLTAEAIAERTARPLLVVSVADIGLNAAKAEQNLERMFQLASKWEAILLVDEADVFLESRVRETDPNRNALVSILLRVLEYYQGIMILTTNRIRSLDVAVQSRIHLAVRYDDLTRKQMCSVLATILNKFQPNESENESIVDNFKEDASYSNVKLNGRQIRNLVISASAIAKAEGKDSISWKDIRQVLKVTRYFQEQLRSLVERERMQREVSKEGD